MVPESASTLEERRRRVAGRVDHASARLAELARALHRLPEPGGEELHSVTRLVGELEEEGFEVETGIAGLATAFRAETPLAAAEAPERPCVAFLAEYDAIPGLGHACGHNLLCAASLGAALALAPELRGGEPFAPLAGRVAVIGAPAEETFGGKVVLAMRGAFDDVDAALLAHPAGEERVRTASLASWSVDVVFEGRSAHAVAAPEEGINALDALIQLFVGRDALLKSLRPEVRMPGVVLEGGVRPNVVPERARARFSLRAHDAGYLVDTLLARFKDLVEGVARATRTRAHVTPVDNLYDEMLSNEELARLWEREGRALGLSPDPGPGRPFGSLDTGTLSHLVPALHPLFLAVPPALPTHTEAFTRAASSEPAFAAVVRAARMLALVGLELLAEPEALERVRAEHLRTRRRLRARIDAPLATGETAP